MRKSTMNAVDAMIYAGYENGQYFVRFGHDVRLIETVDMIRDGYSIVLGYMLMLKRRDPPEFGQYVGEGEPNISIE